MDNTKTSSGDDGATETPSKESIVDAVTSAIRHHQLFLQGESRSVEEKNILEKEGVAESRPATIPNESESLPVASPYPSPYIPGPRAVSEGRNSLKGWLQNVTASPEIQSEPEIIQPPTRPVRSRGPCRDEKDLAWRQRNMTALQLMAQLESKAQQEQVYAGFVDPVVSCHVVEDVEWPSTDCKIRPATDADIAAVTAIFNMEMSAAIYSQIPEDDAIEESDVQEILRDCERRQRPFIVAEISDEYLYNRESWPKTSAGAKAFKRFHEFQKTIGEVMQRQIVGLAYTTEARNGHLNRPCHGSRHTCYLRILVHPGHRRDSYGTALLDRMLLMLAPCHRSLIDYQWSNIDARGIYDTALNNCRKFAHVLVEILADQHEDILTKGPQRLLQKFAFTQIACIPRSIKVPGAFADKWLDLTIWGLNVEAPERMPEDVPQSKTHV